MAYHFPTFIEELFTLFETNQHQLYLVGGCVRDYLLHRTIHDYDMASDATPQEIITICEEAGMKCIPTGIQHGTITVVYQHQHIEMTTFRKEGVYHQHRSPIEVYYTKQVQEDAMRRDFTINAMYMNRTSLLDFYGGQEDLNNRIIRCVHEPNERFKEDALRILRCIRFAYTLSFTIEPTTLQALQQQVTLLNHISKERIRDEFNKILMSHQHDLLIKLHQLGILTILIPEYTLAMNVTQETPYHQYDVFHHMNAVLNHAREATLPQKLALLLHDIAKKNYKTIDEHGIAHFKRHAHASALLSKTILQRLKYDRKTIEKVYTLIDFHDYYVTPKEKILRKLMYKLKGNFSLAYQILKVQKFDNLGKHQDVIKALNKNIDDSILLLQTMETTKPCFTLQDLCINGNTLKALGYEGQQIGYLLDKALYYVVQHPNQNNQPALLTFIGGIQNETINRK